MCTAGRACARRLLGLACTLYSLRAHAPAGCGSLRRLAPTYAGGPNAYLSGSALFPLFVADDRTVNADFSTRTVLAGVSERVWPATVVSAVAGMYRPRDTPVQDVARDHTASCIMYTVG